MASENAIVAKEMSNRGDEELKSLLEEKREELGTMRFKHALGQLSTTHSLKSLKKDIARLKTVLRQRALKAEG